MFLLDSLLVNGIQFVLEKVASVTDAELHNPDRQRERLLEAQLKLESGDIDEAQFAAVEKDVFERIRAIKASTQTGQAVVDEHHRVAGVDITVDDDGQ